MELIYIFLSYPSLYTYLGNSVSLYTDYEKHYCFPQPQTTNRCMRPASLCTYKRNSNSKTWDFWKLQIFFVVGWPLCGALPIHGELLKGSGLYEILVNSNLSVIGKGAVVNANHIKQAIYCLQVTVSAVYVKPKEDSAEMTQYSHQLSGFRSVKNQVKCSSTGTCLLIWKLIHCYI